MRVTARPPALVPFEHWKEIESMSKGTLMDLVWSLAGLAVESSDDTASVIAKIRDEREVVLSYRRGKL